MNLEPLKITLPKSANWLTAQTLAATQAHNAQADTAAAALAQLVTDRAAYEAQDFATADVAELARARQTMLVRTLTWHQSALAAVANRKSLCDAIVADAEIERCKAEERLQERRQTVRKAMEAVGMDPKTAGPDPQAERLVGVVHALRSTAPGLNPDNGAGIQRIQRTCTEALRRAALANLPTLPGEEE